MNVPLLGAYFALTLHGESSLFLHHLFHSVRDGADVGARVGFLGLVNRAEDLTRLAR